jgi:hypothetical protein
MLVQVVVLINGRHAENNVPVVGKAEIKVLYTGCVSIDIILQYIEGDNERERKHN